MKFFFKVISFIFHPIFAPIAGTIAYFLSTPKYSPLELQSGNILPIFILTVIIPIIAFLILKNLGVANTVFLNSVSERKYPLLIHIILLGLILIKVIPNNYIAELYFYFVGLIGAAFCCLFLLYFNFKTSLHSVGISGILMYLINLSIHFEINIVIAIGLMTFFTGIVSSARLYLKAHTKSEVIVGLLIGLLTQLLTVKFWL
ncbi:hypothetical protein [Maribacter cobaltidurans]|uniref:Uncharacterized protein n=1 Tax=Maribacter cobaltidurans TaxID=1178778 RepID=A0A223V2Q9_9FLAO|nr:hypothetical protein [Maribacter cobaltidurans]ASV29527.1 hypothetical protein CJ263_04425 [Maribacter cobaltidurans]GGD68279.1 hypothetical protein GCM10011412_02310 [Maribacter cobaltidurans]